VSPWVERGGKLRSHHVVSAENLRPILVAQPPRATRPVKRGITGVYHHVSETHLKRHPNEFDFRYNERSGLA
jgi:hypothetical protein